jgi:hypothetical protein
MSDTQGRPGPPVAGDETATLLGSLDRQRAIFAWKCGGLDAAGLRATAAASSMTLGGLLKHLALVEDEYFSHRLLGRDPGPPWDAVDWDADPDWEWHSAAADPPGAALCALAGRRGPLPFRGRRGAGRRRPGAAGPVEQPPR